MKLSVPLLILCSVLVGCSGLASHSLPTSALEHRILLPADFSGGRGHPEFLSDAERYVHSFDQGWWSCVELFSKDIDHVVTIGDRAGNGWPAEIRGFGDGHRAAEERIAKLKGKLGKSKAQALLVESLKYPDV